MEALTELTLGVVGRCVEVLESFSHIGVNTHFVKCACIDDKVAELAGGLGFDVILLKYTLSLFLAYPFSAILYLLPSKQAKHAFSLLVGFLMVQWIFGPDWIHSFIAAAGTYVICAFVPKKRMHVVSFLFVMGYMVGAHIYRMYVSYMSGIFDFTGTQMVLTMKLTSFAYNYYDGTYDKKNVFPEKPHEDRRKAKVYADRSRFAVTELPSPLAFFGYVYCFTCILAGPAFEYKDYERAIDGSAYRKPGDSLMTVRKPSSNWLTGLRRLAVGTVCLVLHLKLAAHFQITDQIRPEYISAYGPVVRFVRLMVAILAYRLKYYFAWKVAEGASVMAGFGFEGYSADGKEIGWKGVENVDIYSFETSVNMQSFTRHWNKRTQGWLERYTYNRTNRSLLITYFVSAIWHGLYPGFFFMFMFFPVMTNIERLVKAKINPIIVPGYDGFNVSTYPKGVVPQIYWAFSVVCTMWSVSYVTQTFTLGTLENSLTALRGHGYVPHLFFLALYLILEIIPVKKQRKEGDRKSKAE